MSDEGFHEIQLNGKQLVFLFMAATVVAVVIFLCGVMVGRGVPTRAGSATETPEQASLDPTAALQGAPGAHAVASSGNGPVTAQETLTYPSLLEDPNPPAETLAPPVEAAAETRAPVAAPKPAAAPKAAARPPVAVVPPPPPAAKPAVAAVTPPPAPVAGGLPPSREASADRRDGPQQRTVQPALAGRVAERPDLGGGGQASGQGRANAPAVAAVAPAPPAAKAPVAAVPPPAAAPRPAAAAPVAAAADVTLAEPPGGGFVVQVAAVRQRAEANTIARRLSTKGYPAFVTTAGANFRVRVGKYDDRREAESVAGRLAREEQFKPWITH